MRSPDETNRNGRLVLLPGKAVAPRPRHAGRKRPRALTTLAVYDPATTAAAQARRDNAAGLSSGGAGAGAMVPFVAAVAAAPVVGAEPINAVPLAVAVPATAAPPRTEPWWVRKHLFPHLRLRLDLPVHFIDEKPVTATDKDSHQNRFLIPTDGVYRRLRPLLTVEELEAASLLDEDLSGSRNQQQQQPLPSEELQVGRRKKKRKGRKHGGLPVLVINVGGGIKELQLSRWESSHGTVIKGNGYMDFIARCGFEVGDHVEIWAFQVSLLRRHHVRRELPLRVAHQERAVNRQRTMWLDRERNRREL